MSTKTVAIAGKTASDSSSAIDVDGGASIRIRTDKPLGDGELVKVSVCDSDGSNPVPCKGTAPGAYFLSAGQQSTLLSGPGAYILTKTATSEAVEVVYDS